MSRIARGPRWRWLPVALVVGLIGSASAAPSKKKRVAEKDVSAAAAALLLPDDAIAKAAATRLGEVANSSATAALSAALALGLAPDVALAALEALEARADSAALPVLGYYISVRSKTLRGAAVRAAAATTSTRGDELVSRGLADPTKEVRGIAAEAVASRGITSAAPILVELLVAGEMPAAAALAAIADAEVARAVAETIGSAPNEIVAESLGQMLLRPDFGPDSLRVEVVRALAKVPAGAGAAHLAAYVAATPEKPPRASRREAEKLMVENL